MNGTGMNVNSAMAPLSPGLNANLSPGLNANLSPGLNPINTPLMTAPSPRSPRLSLTTTPPMTAPSPRSPRLSLTTTPPMTAPSPRSPRLSLTTTPPMTAPSPRSPRLSLTTTPPMTAPSPRSPRLSLTTTPPMAAIFPRLSLTSTPVMATSSTVKSTSPSFASLSPGLLSPCLSSLSAERRTSSPFSRSSSRSPTPSIMTSPKLWQKTSISRLAEEFFWIGGSVVAQPKWRLGQYVERCMCTMQTGTQMTKLKGKKKGLVRFFYLDEHKSCIRWRPSRKHDKAKITIDSIHEVCEGKKSEIFQRYADSCFDPNCCFSIYHGDHVESLDLVSANGDEARTWITGLKYLMAGISDEDSLAKRQRKRDQWLQQTFSEADKNGDGNLSLGEVLQLLHKLNVNLPRQKVREMFKKADTDDNQGSLAFEEFCTFYKMMSTRRGLYLIMLSYSNNKEFMDLNDLVRFMENEQKMAGVTREYCLEIVSQFEPCSQNLQNMVLGIDGFTNYMRSPAGDIFKPDHHHVHQDMTQPLCNYFIASSHNTYLTGDQLLSESRVDMYAYVLQAGCRCVEVDCWDGPDGEPIVHHGYTLTSKILFKDVIETINKYAFTKNQYPVILSIENHCTVPQQKKMAEYLLEVLQDKVDLSTVNMNEFRKLPSPELLKGKVLVKGKKLPANIDDDAEEGDVSDEDSEEEEDEDDTQINTDGNAAGTADESKPKKRRSIMGSFRRKRKKKKKKKLMLNLDHADQENPIMRDKTQIVYHNKKGKTMRLSRALSDLVKYTKSVRVHDIETQAYMTSWQVSSLNESIVNQIMALKPAQLVRLNQRQLLRVYPSNYRVDSSNFNPQPFWNAGCHMVALNYQTEGRMLELNRAKFSTNGNCGYLLKPRCMNKGFFNPTLEDPLPGQSKTQLVLKIISGQQLPKPKDSMLGDRGEIIDPFVEVEIIGLPIDCCKQQTRVVDDNGFNPMWEESLVFTLHMTQIALVRFQVWDHDPIGQNFIGQRTIAFVSMMPGYRHVYLEGMEEASIFVHVAVNDITGKVKPSNAVKGFLKKATKKGSAKEPKTVSMHLSTYSSEDVRQRYRKDLDSYSQESSGNGSMLLTPAGIDYLHRGTQSEPLKRAHTVQILEEEIQGASPKEEKKTEGKRKGILVRMSSTFSNSGASIPCITATSPDLEDVFQSSQPQSPEPESQMQSFQAAWPDLEDQVQSFHAHWLGRDNSGRSFEPEWPDPPEIEDIAGEPPTKLNSKPALQTVTEHLNQPQPQLHPQPQSLPQAQPQSLPQAQPQSLPQAQPQSHPEVILRNRHPPSSPARVRRTLETPASQRPSNTSRTKARSRSVPRKQHTSPITPVVNRRAAVHWQPQTPSPPPQNHCRYGHQPIPNGLYLSDSDSSSVGSIDSLSLELLPSRVPVSGQREVGTLQREMNALFDQKMKEIRCKSPLFFYDYSTL